MGAGGSERCNDQVTLEVEPEAGGARALPVPEETASASALRQNHLLLESYIQLGGQCSWDGRSKEA